MTRVSIGPLAPGRECGACTACCTVMTIDWPELQKPAGVTCEHAQGGGCAIHPTRPSGCRTWFCLWREHPALPDAARPDRCGLMISIEHSPQPETPFERRFVVLRAVNGPADLKGAWADDLVRFCSQGRLPVYLAHAGRMDLAHPPRKLAKMIMGGKPVAAGWSEEVGAWRKALNIEAASPPPSRARSR